MGKGEYGNVSACVASRVRRPYGRVHARGTGRRWRGDKAKKKTGERRKTQSQNEGHGCLESPAREDTQNRSRGVKNTRNNEPRNTYASGLLLSREGRPPPEVDIAPCGSTLKPIERD